MIRFQISNMVLEKAKKLDENIGVQNGSITGGAKQIHGYVGKIIIKQSFPKFFSRTDVRVRTTTVEPQAHYMCGFFASDVSAVTKKEYIVFMRVHENMTKGWALGWMRVDEFLDRAKFYKRGDKEPYSPFTFKADSYAMRVKELNSFKSTLNL